MFYIFVIITSSVGGHQRRLCFPESKSERLQLHPSCSWVPFPFFPFPFSFSNHCRLLFPVDQTVNSRRRVAAFWCAPSPPRSPFLLSPSHLLVLTLTPPKRPPSLGLGRRPAILFPAGPPGGYELYSRPLAQLPLISKQCSLALSLPLSPPRTTEPTISSLLQVARPDLFPVPCLYLSEPFPLLPDSPRARYGCQLVTPHPRSPFPPCLSLPPQTSSHTHTLPLPI